MIGTSINALHRRAEAASAAGDHAVAIALYTEALALIPAADEQEWEMVLLLGRAASALLWGDYPLVEADLHTLRTHASIAGVLAREVEVMERLVAMLCATGRAAEGYILVKALLERVGGAPRLQALCLAALAEVGYSLGDLPQVRSSAEQLMAASERMDDPIITLHALKWSCLTACMSGELNRASDFAERQLALASAIGGRYEVAIALNSLALASNDTARSLARYKDALALFQALGARKCQAMVANNLAFLFRRLGLYVQALHHAREAVFFGRALGAYALLSQALDSFGHALLGVDELEEAQGVFHECKRLAVANGDRKAAAYSALGLGQLALVRGEPEVCEQQLQAAVAAFGQLQIASMQMLALAWLGAAQLTAGLHDAALSSTAQAAFLLEHGHISVDFPSQEVWWWRSQALTAAGEGKAAFAALRHAYHTLLKGIVGLSSAGLRRNYLSKVATNREIVLAYSAEVVRRGLTTEPLAGEGPPAGHPGQLRRVLEAGVRMAALRDLKALPGFIIDEMVELSGVERTALVIVDEAGEQHWAYHFGAGVEELAPFAAPTLDAAIAAYRPVLRDRAGAGGTMMQSFAVPLIAQGRVRGLLYGDIRTIFGRLDEHDLDLLALLGNQAAVALENARLYQSLEHRVAEHTAELEQRNAELEQRNAELALINGVQQALSAQLDVTAIFDLVGDHIRNIFNAQVVDIGIYDRTTGLLHFPYWIERGVRYTSQAISLFGIRKHLIESRRPMIINTAKELTATHERFPKADDDWGEDPKTVVFIPLVVGDEARGYISLQDLDREYAFSESDIRLINTLAASMSVALESARLFDKTRQLLAETEQRAAQLATVNAVGQALAAELELNVLIELAGEQIRTTFGADCVYVALYDGVTDAISFPYYYELGARSYGDTLRYGQGLTSQILRSGQPLLLNDRIEDFEERTGVRQVGTRVKSYLGVPIIGGQQTLGVLSVQSIHIEGRFDEDDMRLLSTLAANVGVAITNARLFAEAHEARSAAEQANQAKSTFLASMSHELRTPLNAVLGFAQVLEGDQTLSARQREYLSIISGSGEHLLGLINDVLQVSKIEAGRLALHQEVFDLPTLLRGVEELLQLRAEAKGIYLVTEAPPGLPQHVIGDEGKLRQVLLNLIGNAVKFTEAGGVVLRVAYDSALGRLLVEVADSGVGIAEVQLATIFEAFAQTDSGLRTGEGSGLGLTISRQYVLLMGGDIVVTSQPGQGSTFSFSVTLPAGEAREIDAREHRRVVGIESPPGQEYRILVVDDRWESRRLLVTWLERAGFAVQEATNGEEALALWDSWSPQLIWMDVRMPVIDGLEATRRIKATAKGQQTVVIVLTASVFEHERETLIAAGCDDFVRKPVRESVIFAKLSDHLGVRYIYEVPQPSTPTRTPPEAIALARRNLSSEQRSALRDAALGADLEQIRQLSAQIHDAALAAHLLYLVDTFQIDLLQRLLAENGADAVSQREGDQ